MHVYFFTVMIELPCAECGTMNAGVLKEMLEEDFSGIPAAEVTVNEISEIKNCDSK